LLLVSGFCGFVAFPFLFTVGVSLTSANHGSMILAALPVFTGAIAMAWERKTPGSLWITGCLVALSGEAVLIYGSGSNPGQDASIGGDLLILVSNVFASLGYVAGARLQQTGYPAQGTTFWGVSIFAILLLPLMPAYLGPVQWTSVSVQGLLSLLYLGMAVTVLGYVMWYWALGRGGIARIGLIQFFQPVSGVVLAWILLNEQVTAGFSVVSATILLGVWIAMRGK
jgi:drug/metabolite transporter (DMT)-like permease